MKSIFENTKCIWCGCSCFSWTVNRSKHPHFYFDRYYDEAKAELVKTQDIAIVVCRDHDDYVAKILQWYCSGKLPWDHTFSETIKIFAATPGWVPST